MAGPQHLGRLDPGFQCDQLITQIGQLAGERRPRFHKLLGQLVPAIGADRFVIPRVQLAGLSDRYAVNGGHDRAHQSRVETGVGGLNVDPLVHPDLPAVHGGEDASSVVRRTCGVGTPAV